MIADFLPETSPVRDHDFAKVATPLEMPVGLLRLDELERPINHRVQVVHDDRPVHGLEIWAAPDADRPDGNAAAR